MADKSTDPQKPAETTTTTVDTTTTTATEPPKAPEPGTPEYDAAMVKKAEETAAAAQDRPQWLPEGFDKPEDLAAAYAEMKAKAPADAPADKPVAPDFGSLETKYRETGALEDGDFQALEAMGITKPMVEAYIAGQKAIAEATLAPLVADIGGPEAFAKMSEWAANGMPEADLKAYNDLIDSGDPAKIKAGLLTLQSSFEAVNGRDPALLTGNTGPSSTSGFTNRAEVVKAMADKRYATDPAYRKMVADKLSNTPNF